MAAWLAVWAASSAAQEPPDPAPKQRSAYEREIEAALEEYERGNWTEAIALFKRAHHLQPSARTHRGLGLAYFEARRYALALEHLEAALADTRRALTAEQRQGVETVLRRTRPFVARYVVQLRPESAHLELDGNAVTLVGGELLMDSGRHQLIARAERHRPEQRTLETEGGQRSELVIELRPVEERGGDHAGHEHAVATPEVDRGPGLGPYVLGAGGGALLIGSGVTYLLADSIYESLDAACDDKTCERDIESDRNTGKVLDVASGVLLAGGLASIAGALAWWFLDGAAEREPGPPPASAACDTSGCRASLRVTF